MENWESCLCLSVLVAKGELMIFKKSYSFIILPHHGEQGKSVFFHSQWLNALLLITVAGLGVSGFFIARHLLYHHKLKTAFEPTFKENEVLREERKGYGQVKDSLSHDISSLQAQLKKERSVYLSSVNGLARELDNLKKLAIKVKIQSGFKSSNIVDENEAGRAIADGFVSGAGAPSCGVRPRLGFQPWPVPGRLGRPGHTHPMEALRWKT